jgi:hypothetical protein
VLSTRCQLLDYQFPGRGKVFATITECKRHLGARFSRLFHGKETRNWRKPEDHVEREEKGHINSRRQRKLTLTGKLTCQWSVRVTWKNIGIRGSGNKGFVMTVTCLDHVHELSSNALSFPRHRQSLDEWQAFIRTVRKHCEAMIPYSESRRVLQSAEFGITISARGYYNSARKMILDQGQLKMIDGLLVALQEEEFVCRARMKIEEDDAGEIVER